MASPVSYVIKRDIVRVQGRILKFYNPLSKFETGEDKSFKFGIGLWIDLGKSHLISDQIPQKGRGQGPGSKF